MLGRIPRFLFTYNPELSIESERHPVMPFGICPRIFCKVVFSEKFRFANARSGLHRNEA
jgi:hypothetical protein